jgi:superfamily I DNA/RNA helicase
MIGNVAGGSPDSDIGVDLSPQQIAIRDFVLDEDGGHGIVGAFAGTGKTFTLVNVIAPHLKNAVFCAFNAHIAKELRDKLKGTGVEGRTIHSLAYAGIRDVFPGLNEPDGSKYRRMAKELFDEAKNKGEVFGQYVRGLQKAARKSEDWPVPKLVKLASLVRVTLTDPADTRAILALADRYGVDVDQHSWAFIEATIAPLLRWGVSVCAQSIDFDDMVWLPNICRGFIENGRFRFDDSGDLVMRPQRYDWVLVDEVQDLNAAQRGIVTLALNQGGRMLAVGDRFQAIYGFSGADCDSFDLMKDQFDATEMPLPTCYRCPESHLELAQEIVPGIEPAPGAEQGEIEAVEYDAVQDWIRPGDLVVCRMTAPVVDLCYSLILSGVQAFVRGRDIGKGITAIFDKAMKRGANVASFPMFLADYEAIEVDKLRARDIDDGDNAMIRLLDRINTARLLSAKSKAGTLKEMKAEIEAMFSDKKDGKAVTLSTVHRAKGLEADRVLVIDEDMMPLGFANTADQKRQEWNIRYIAFTRAMKTLAFTYSDRSPATSCPMAFVNDQDDTEDAEAV